MNDLKIVFVSDWFDNPYKNLLIKHLKVKNILITEHPKSFIFIFNVLKRCQPDVLHLHTLHYFFVSRNKLYFWFKFLVFIGQVLILRWLGIKTVWTVHEWKDKISDGNHNISNVKAAILGKTLSAIITHCESTKQEISTGFKLKDQNKVFVIPHGNYIGCYENKIGRIEARKALNIPAESVVFLIFGGIHPSKGVLEAIDTFKHLRQDEVHLVIAGKPNTSQLRELIIEKAQETKNIFFVDPKENIPDDDIQLYMNSCDVVLLPYKVFTTSGVALLAISYGRACIAPRLGFFSDILDDSGAFLYDSTSEDGLLFAMKSAIENKDNLLSMGSHNLKLAEQWNWDYVSEQTSKVYQWCARN